MHVRLFTAHIFVWRRVKDRATIKYETVDQWRSKALSRQYDIALKI